MLIVGQRDEYVYGAEFRVLSVDGMRAESDNRCYYCGRR
jgi:hypothetical protein